MRTFLHCPSCDPSADQFAIDFVPKNDSVHEIECPNGHRFSANLIYHEFQKLCESAVNALADAYYREAVSSFAASYERFIELFTIMRTRLLARIGHRATIQRRLMRCWRTSSKFERIARCVSLL